MSYNVIAGYTVRFTGGGYLGCCFVSPNVGRSPKYVNKAPSSGLFLHMGAYSRICTANFGEMSYMRSVFSAQEKTRKGVALCNIDTAKCDTVIIKRGTHAPP